MFLPWDLVSLCLISTRRCWTSAGRLSSAESYQYLTPHLHEKECSLLM
jgi:hypothetical protein